MKIHKKKIEIKSEWFDLTFSFCGQRLRKNIIMTDKIEDVDCLHCLALFERYGDE